MNTCERVKRDLVAFLYRELEADGMSFIRAHLASCPACQAELETLKLTLEGADSLSPGLQEALEEVDWNSLPARIVDRILVSEARPRRRFQPVRIFHFLLKPVYAGLLAGLIVGSMATWLALRNSVPRQPRPSRFFASAEFLENVDLEIARRDTLDYLEKSQNLLLDVFQSSSQEVSFFEDPAAVLRTQDLLSRKKYLNPQLDKLQMSKAKEICDQIEILILELAQIAGRLSPQQMEEIQNMVEEKRILLKINLVRQELEGSEA